MVAQRKPAAQPAFLDRCLSSKRIRPRNQTKGSGGFDWKYSWEYYCGLSFLNFSRAYVSLCAKLRYCCANFVKKSAPDKIRQGLQRTCVICRLQNIHVLLVKKPEVMLYNRICSSSIMLKDVEPWKRLNSGSLHRKSNGIGGSFCVSEEKVILYLAEGCR